MSQKIQSVERRANTIVNLLGLDVPLWTEEREHVVGSISVSFLSKLLRRVIIEVSLIVLMHAYGVWLHLERSMMNEEPEHLFVECLNKLLSTDK